MKIFYSVILVLLTAFTASAQTPPANYLVVLNKFKQFYNGNKPDSVYNMFSPELKASITADKWNTTTSQLKAQLGTLNQAEPVEYIAPTAIYKAVFANATFLLNISLNNQNKLIGIFFKPYKDPFVTIPVDPSLTESPVALKTLSGTVSGTLSLPKDATGKLPVVLIIAGSGPTDRDGNNNQGSLSGNTYKMLANELGKNGIASLRYDKRGIGQSVSSTKPKEMRFDDYVDDAVGLINMLNDDSRFSKIVVLGHSEGSLVGMLACRDQPAKAFISIAGAGQPADKIMTEQMKAQPQYIADNFKLMLDSLKKGKFTDKIDPKIYAIAGPDMQPYLASWFRYDPARELKKIKLPMLILQGTTDIQVTVADAEKLKKAAPSDAKLVIIPGMNHVLKEAPADKALNTATYTKPNLPLKPELVSSIVDFVKGLK
ncbi:alpha/beta fold hydrolase [Mucilaginibacter sp.]|uniref:alpha/beta fold hydrolase n=1 Tax=Mucilaginibacter sp. TaxID=1882438 RepID=UPI0035BBE0EF